jgi:hypothetical protein
MGERRKFQRVPFETEAEINCKEKKSHGKLLDISLQGALIQGKGTIPFETGNVCDLSIHLSGTDITLQFDVDLVHREDNRFGLRFIGEDTETMTHLKRLLESNIGSSEVIDKEISFWLRRNI